MQYDNDMEDMGTHRDHQSQGPNKHMRHTSDELRQESIVSHDTHSVHKKPEVLVSGRFEDYKEINICKYDFNTSSIGDNASIGNAYEEPKIVIPNLKGRNVIDQAQSQTVLNTMRQYSVPGSYAERNNSQFGVGLRVH